MSKALVLIDLQNDYFPGGRMELSGADAALAQAARLLAKFRDRAMPVIHIQHIAKQAGASFFLPDTAGAEIHPAVRPSVGERVIVKHFPSAFRGTDLAETLRTMSVTKLVMAGMMTHMCVDTSVRAAADLGFQCSLAHDACATKDLQFGDSKVAAVDVQVAYLAALNGAFASVRSGAALSEEL